MYEPAIGDVVGVTLGPDSFTVGEVVQLLACSTVGVRVTEDGSELYGQTVYFNAGQLAPVTFRRVQ